MTIRLNGQTSGYVELEAPATAGSNTLVLPTNNGSSGDYLQTDGSGTLSWQTVASLSNAEDGTGTNFEFNSGFGSNGVAYGVRAWIDFDGTAATIGTGNGSGNMDAVTDNGTGDYTVNFTNDMPDNDYCPIITGTTFSNGRMSSVMIKEATTLAVGGFTVTFKSKNNVSFNSWDPYDPVDACIAVVR